MDIINNSHSTELTEILPWPLITFLEKLHRIFEPRRQELLSARNERQREYDKGKLPQYLDPDPEIVSGTWMVDPIPERLKCRRVEITGPANSKKMVINMLNRNEHGHRADMAMLDFEDSMRPTFDNVVAGHKNVIEAVAGTLEHISDEGRIYKVDTSDMAYVMVRVRGLHLDETHLLVDGRPISAGLFDLAVSFYHNAKVLLSQNMPPKYYVPKCEHYLEARWWNELFTALEKSQNLNIGTLKATFLIETLPATFQIEEILYEIREHATGLNVGRWDKIFSDIKVLRHHDDRVMPDRATINMGRPWMENYAKRVIKICHDRGAFAMGGMSAFTPGKTEAQRAEQTMKVLEDKQREADWGHDGCWVSHPYFIGVAMQAFKQENQLTKKLSAFNKFPDIMPIRCGPYTMAGLRTNIRVGIAYMHGWNKGLGCVSFDNLMEDLATLEISRAQTWQWLRHGISLEEGPKVTKELALKIFDEEFQKILKEDSHKFLELELLQARNDAADLFLKDELQDFLSFGHDNANTQKDLA